MHSTVSPVFAFLHTSSAPANVAPAVMPTKMPSFCASSRLHFMASRLVDHSDCTIGGRRKHNLGAEEPHEFAALDTEDLCHRDNQRIPFRCADHRKTDSSIA